MNGERQHAACGGTTFGRPLLIVISAPSGAGKTTLCDCLLRDRRDIVYSVSCTTRPPRGDEIDGQDYLFVSADEFEARVRRREFLEHATVHGHRYGTLRKTVMDALAEGKSVLMDIDVLGARQVRARAAEAGAGDPLHGSLVDIFIEPPSLAVLRSRLEGRAEDSPGVIEERLRNAAAEMADRDEFTYRVVNDDVERAYAELSRILARAAESETG
jgi:guanylate kinase